MSAQELRNIIINSNVEFYNNLFSNAPDSEIIHLYSLYFYVREEIPSNNNYNNAELLRNHLLNNVRDMCSLYYDRMQYMEPETQQIARSDNPEYKAANADFEAIYTLEEEEEGYNYIVCDYNELVTSPIGSYNYIVQNETAERVIYGQVWINRPLYDNENNENNEDNEQFEITPTSEK